MARYNASPARAAVAEYCKLAQKYEVTPSELAIAWCNQRLGSLSTEESSRAAVAHDLADVVSCILVSRVFLVQVDDN